MPDVHFAEGVCVGVVVATRDTLLPEAVGSDVGCGMAALRLGGDAAPLREERTAARLLGALARAVPVNRRGGASLRSRLPAPLDDVPLSEPALEREKGRDARVQLGTLGRGNHFLELQEDEEGRLWLAVHSGSRGIGRAIAEAHLRRAARPGGGLARFPADSDEGRAYLADVEWGLAYARANRRAIAEATAPLVRDFLGRDAEWGTWLDCAHNHVRRETHAGEALWVHRKGAISAAAGEPGIVPGSMGTASYHVEGRGVAESLSSSSHGAGRAMGRGDARSRIRVRDLRRQMEGVWFDRGKEADLLDEAPGAYKDVRAVMKAQRELTRIVRRLRPRLCYKGV
jgi:tRNA-splicing ligase RtcB